jgi:hypothetical protein
MPTADQVGLVPGFALQDGDKIAQLLEGAGGAGGVTGGGLGLGNTVSLNVNLSGSSNINPVGSTQVVSSVTVITVVTPTGNSLQLATIPVCTLLRVFNQSAEVAHIFPRTGQSIDGAPASESVWLSGGARCDYLYLGGNAWISDLLGSPSA